MIASGTHALRYLGLAAALFCPPPGAQAAAPDSPETLRTIVDRVVEPLMAADHIPGMAVAVTLGGKADVFSYGHDAPKDGHEVTPRTLFEIGSLSKTFTGALGAYVAAKGRLSLSDPAPRHLPQLAGTAFDRITLLDLATYTAGGLPLQFPGTVKTDAETTTYFQHWRPGAPPETKRLYSNASIGLFGDLAARADRSSFRALMTNEVLPKLGLAETFLDVPQGDMARYAWGTGRTDGPVRVSPGPFDAEAYGIKTTAGDMIRFVQLALDPSTLDPPMREALAAQQMGYFRFGPAMQGLGWEIYDAPPSPDVVLAGSAPAVALTPQPVTRIDPPQAPKPDRFVNKTGSTKGFGAYAAFVPERRTGIVLLANRNYPVPDRIGAAWAILDALRPIAIGH